MNDSRFKSYEMLMMQFFMNEKKNPSKLLDHCLTNQNQLDSLSTNEK